MKWVLATRNRGKAAEFESLLKNYPITILTLKDIGFSREIRETGSTFAENSAIKARAVLPYSEFTVLADDSGLEVESLKGAPGIYSARFAGERSSDEENNLLLLKNMIGCENRKARFICCLTLINKSGNAKNYSGECCGSISQISKGDKGFGYDSVFIPSGYSKTLGELGNVIKEKISHRTMALNHLTHELF